jgi:DNA-binding CsgD family transcriptional regulator
MNLHGRDPECQAIDGLLAQARRSRSAALVLYGEAGMGKTTLLEYAAARATDLRVLRVDGVQPEADLPYAAVHRLLRPVLPLLDEIPGVQAAALRGALAMAADRPPNRFAVSLAVLSLLAEAAATGPVLCLIDDAQWLDGPSADALSFAGRRLDAEGVVLLFAVREGEAAAFPGAGLPRWDLPGIGADAADRLLAQHFGAEIAADVRRSVRDAGQGNPLALLEIPSALNAGQRLGHVPLPDPMPIGADLERILLDQIRRLPAGAQEVLLVAAAESEADVVLEAAGRLGIDPGALPVATAAGLLHQRGGGLVFRHPILRTAVYRAAGPDRRRAVHRVLAEVLTGERDADRRAWHRAAQAPGTDDSIADELAETAGRAGRRGGHATAATALQRAADLTSDPEKRAARLIGAARAAWDAGRPAQAGALLELVDTTADPAAYAALRHVQGELELHCGLPAEGAKVLLDGAGQIAGSDPDRALQMLLDAALCALYTSDHVALADTVRQAQQLAPVRSASEAPLVDVLAAVAGMLDRNPAGPDRLARWLDQVARSADANALVWGGAVATAIGEAGRGESMRRRAEAVARRTAAVGTLATVLERISWVELNTGDLTDAAMHSLEGLELARAAALTNSACFHQAVLSWVAAVQGDERECVELAARAASAALAHGLGPHYSILLWAGGLLDLGQGRWADATVRLDAMSAPGTGHPHVARTALPDLVEAAVRAGRDGVARAAAERYIAYTETGAPPWQRALAARCRALIGPGAAREELLTEALALHGPDPRPFAQARTQLLLGEHLRRERRRAEARPSLTAAAETFGRLGARPWETRARAELRATGETTRKRAPHTAGQLTPQQVQIVRMVATGATNKEVAAQLFLSTRTVDYHLRNVFVKLGIVSRAELIRLDLGGSEPGDGDIAGVPPRPAMSPIRRATSRGEPERHES